MGSCLSKKNVSSSSTAPAIATSLAAAEDDKPRGENVQPVTNEPRIKKTTVEERHEKNQQAEPQEEGSGSGSLKKEIFVIKHRKSHDRDKCCPPSNSVDANANDKLQAPDEGNETINTAVKTLTCTKEEVDAILIQCGRLSRSNSSGAGKTISSGRKYSGSKRSYDFDHNDYHEEDLEAATSADYDAKKKGNGDVGDDEVDAMAERREHRQRHRQSSRPSSSHGRRRTPSREREQQSQRSGSRERISSSGGSGRRVSRSPGRRSETNPSTTSTTTNATANRPGKMVSVPATVSCLALDKSNNGVEPQTTGAITRTSVKRNVGEAAAAATSRGTASPRSQSPSRYNQQQPPSLSRSSSRKADQSPYRRIPLTELDNNSLPTGSKATSITRAQTSTKEVEELVTPVQQSAAEASSRVITAHVARCKASSIGLHENKLIKEQPPVTTTSAALGGEGSLNLQKMTRSRSFRRSQDFDLNHEALTNPPASYTTLLLEDIHNFHQKNTNPAFSLPHCVTKACSILEAVADLNSTTNSNLSCAFSDERRSHPAAKKASDVKDPFVESEVLANDDLTEPSIHKYVTLRRGGGPPGDALCGEDMDGQESSGSNSVVGGNGNSHNWGISSSSWEPSSADSTDRWSSRSHTGSVDEKSSQGFQRGGCSSQRTGIGRGRAGGATKILRATTTNGV